jgi:hypothetical protein
MNIEATSNSLLKTLYVTIRKFWLKRYTVIYATINGNVKVFFFIIVEEVIVLGGNKFVLCDSVRSEKKKRRISFSWR